MLEQSESLRTGGTSLTLFKNGWSVLDSIGVADNLRTQYLEIQGYVNSLFVYLITFITCIVAKCIYQLSLSWFINSALQDDGEV